jgi:hypothetical protein
MEQLIQKAREQSTDEILYALTLIGGGEVSKPVQMARAALIEVYVEREGREAGETLMDAMEM